MRMYTKLFTLLLLIGVSFTSFSAQQGKNKKTKKTKVQKTDVKKPMNAADAMPSKAAETSDKKENAQIGLSENSTSLPLNKEVRYGKLANGLTYYIQHNTKPENRVEFRLAVNAGSNQEEDNQKGLAHFVEHMAFNGSKHFSKNELVNYLE